MSCSRTIAAWLWAAFGAFTIARSKTPWWREHEWALETYADRDYWVGFGS